MRNAVTGHRRRSRIAPRLNVPHTGKELVAASSGWVGKNNVASPPRIAAALPDGLLAQPADRRFVGKPCE
ncbi:hypothetical protein NSPZN2_50128 [Nitrospira defluvii]|uniref:Uncharacterized protein n=1 Tax=Nitrospira defluvii TaxID=330214 RepID=A0ABM8S3I1_9BACT|nr:hypothetical protein NSPZN2_50128 [Nitrospira defluvii]